MILSSVLKVYYLGLKLGFSGLCYSLSRISGVLKLYLLLFGLNLVFFGLVLSSIEDFRCVETVPGPILTEIGFFGLVIFDRGFRVC